MTTLWASDTNFSDPGKGWDATPTKVTPSSGAITQGFLPEELPPAQHINWAIATLGGRVSASSDEYTYTTVKSRTKRVSVLLGRNMSANWVLTSGGVWSNTSFDGTFVEVPLCGIVPSGCTLKSVYAYCLVGTNRATVGNRVQLSVYKIGSTGTNTQIGSTASDTGSSGFQTITVGSLTEVIDLSSYEYFARIKAGAVNSGSDGFYALTVTFDDIGPRNS